MKAHFVIALVLLLIALHTSRPPESPTDGWLLQPRAIVAAAPSPIPIRNRVERIVYRSTASVVVPGISIVLIMLGVVATLLLRIQRREMAFVEERLRFLNVVSHELKTPLTNIRLYAELLREALDEKGAPEHRHADVVVSEAERLSRLVANVLLLHAPTTGARVSCDPHRLVDDVLRQFGPALDAFTVHTTIDLPPRMQANPDMLKQILANLVSNVEKYAGAGRYLGIDAFEERGAVIFAVRDRGPGVPMQAREAVFEPFVRLKPSLEHEPAGAGLGLSISRELARSSGGDLEIGESDVGSVFLLSLPSHPRDEEGAAA